MHFLRRSIRFWLIWSIISLSLGLLFTSNARPSLAYGPAPAASDMALRGREPHTVWIIGDSLTHGLFASSEETAYRNLLFRALQANHPGSIHTTFWMGVCTLAGLEASWDSFVGQPDVLFLELGINDLGNQHCPQVPEASWKAHYGAMLDKIRADAPGVQIIVGTIPWCNWPADSDEFSHAQKYNGWIREEARARLIPVADLWQATLNKKDGISTPDQPSVFPPYFHGDYFHPNDIGHQRLAQTFFQTYRIHQFQIFLPFHR